MGEGVKAHIEGHVRKTKKALHPPEKGIRGTFRGYTLAILLAGKGKSAKMQSIIHKASDHWLAAQGG